MQKINICYLTKYPVHCKSQYNHMFYEIVCVSELYTSIIKSYDFLCYWILAWQESLIYWNWVKTFVHLCHIDFEPIVQVSSPSDFYVIEYVLHTYCLTQATQATWVLFARKNNKYNWFYLLFSLDLTSDVYNLFWMKLCLAAGSMILRLHICSFCFGALI